MRFLIMFSQVAIDCFYAGVDIYAKVKRILGREVQESFTGIRVSCHSSWSRRFLLFLEIVLEQEGIHVSLNIRHGFSTPLFVNKDLMPCISSLCVAMSLILM